MKELVSPAQSELLVALLSGVLLVVGLAWGWRAAGARGLLAGLVGPLVFGLWQFHKYVTRYQPATESQPAYFGLDKVKVLLFEVVLFIAVGAALGWAWGVLSRNHKTNPGED